jgi:hypothetical protein
MQKEIKRVATLPVHRKRNHQNIKGCFNEEVDFLGANIDFDANELASGLSNTLKEY